MWHHDGSLMMRRQDVNGAIVFHLKPESITGVDSKALGQGRQDVKLDGVY